MSVRTREPAPAPDDPRRRRLMLAITAVVVVLVAAGVVAWVVDESGDDPGQSSIPSSDAGEGSDEKRPMVVGDATASLDRATSEVGGGKRGFPHNTAGAVEAATALHIRMVRGPIMPDSENKTFLKDALPGEAMRSGMETLRSSRKAIGADGNGVVDGLAPGQRYYADCLPQYGAYSVREGPKKGVIDVFLWMPCIYGPGAPGDTEDLRVAWDPMVAEMEWSAGDWRAWKGQYGDTPEDWGSLNVKDPNRPDVSFTERASIFTGGDWKLYSDASEEWPSDLLGDSPEGSK